MFSKILIANRGEIACRIIRTARRMGIRTAAVFSDADRGALHVEMADEAVSIGGAAASDSYLNAAALIEAAQSVSAEAVHPGYGFLSENPEFVDAVEAAGLAFIGPSAAAIRAMGLKDAAKRLMEKAGVPVVPGYHGEAQDLVVLAGKANEIGYPVLIKARAGGGGKGMRKVDAPGQFADALSAAKREAESSFGDGRVLVEKFVASPRHIEIQVFGDGSGDAVYLFERDCSLQRRHQKVIEEAPAPGMTPQMRQAMGKAAVRAAQAIGYSGAGTVEFIVDGSGGLSPDRFFFMEMNTRLQVEHPVTEMITGLDLVEWQLRVAVGEPLPKRQEDLAIDGWSFEARLYAEDAGKNFLPATGELARLRFPENDARIDSGVREGDTITPYYDPMIAKIITHGPDRETALRRLSAALDGTIAVGTTTNIDFLRALSRQADFAAGRVDTGLIERTLPDLVAAPAVDDTVVAAAALALLELDRTDAGPRDPFSAIGLWSHWLPAKRVVHLNQGERSLELAVLRTAETGWTVTTYQPQTQTFGPVELHLLGSGTGTMRLLHGDRVFDARCVRHGSGLTMIADGMATRFEVPDQNTGGEEADAASDRLFAPMPGLVKQIAVMPGRVVSKGQTLIVMEAMKMELSLPAPRDGVVEDIPVEVGDQVSDGTLLLGLRSEEG